MWKFYCIMLYWLICGLWGNRFIQLKIIGGINPFYILMGVGFLYVAYCLLRLLCLLRVKGKVAISNYCDVKRIKNWLRSVGLFSLLSVIYIILSYCGFFNYILCLTDANVDFNKAYILRQGYLVLTFPIAFMLIDIICKNEDKILEFMKSNKLSLIWVLTVLLRYLAGNDHICFGPLILTLATAIYLYHPYTLKGKFILLFSVVVLINWHMTSVALGITAVLISLKISDLSFYFFSRNFEKKTYFFIVLFIVLLVAMNKGILKITDANSVWRLQYWTNEFNVLKKILFMGVGYGTAYASNSIYGEINNPAVFISQAKEGTSLMVVVQHNSFVNLLYRLGIVGFILGVKILIVDPISLYGKTQISASKENKVKLKWAFANYLFNLIIIALNPGLESPRFYIGFLISFSFLIGFLICENKNSETFCNRTLYYQRKRFC